MEHHQESEKTELLGGVLEECVRNCRLCEEACVELIAHCLDKGGEHARPDHVRILMDCAESCRTAVSFMLRKSDAHPLYCGACAEVCYRCAEDCQRFQDDEQMSRCAQICRQCADTCRQMSGQSGAV